MVVDFVVVVVVKKYFNFLGFVCCWIVLNKIKSNLYFDLCFQSILHVVILFYFIITLDVWVSGCLGVWVSGCVL